MVMSEDSGRSVQSSLHILFRKKCHMGKVSRRLLAVCSCWHGQGITPLLAGYHVFNKALTVAKAALGVE